MTLTRYPGKFNTKCQVHLPIHLNGIKYALSKQKFVMAYQYWFDWLVRPINIGLQHFNLKCERIFCLVSWNAIVNKDLLFNNDAILNP